MALRATYFLSVIYGDPVDIQGGRFVLSRSNPLEIGLKLHYQVKKQLFSAQNGGRK